MRSSGWFVAGLAAFGVTSAAVASEGSGGAYPNGAEALSVAVLPPPGTYLLNYLTYYDADRLNDAHGNSQVPGFSVQAYAEIPRFVHVTDVTLFGATWAQQIFVPLVDLNVHAAGARDHKTGIGDIIVDPFVFGWSRGNNHFILAMDIFVPTGRYDKNALANIGRNYWTFEPVFAVSHIDPQRRLEASAKLMYDFNTKNNATDYSSGQEFHADFAVAYDLKPVTVGLNGYYYKQTTDDTVRGVKVGPYGNRGEAFALGPTIRYQAGKIPLSFQWQHEIFAHNRPQGDKVWLKAALRF